jgi:hypothetical protein
MSHHVDILNQSEHWFAVSSVSDETLIRLVHETRSYQESYRQEQQRVERRHGVPTHPGRCSVLVKKHKRNWNRLSVNIKSFLNTVHVVSTLVCKH